MIIDNNCVACGNIFQNSLRSKYLICQLCIVHYQFFGGLFDFSGILCYPMSERQVRQLKIRNMALCALFAALLCVCAWISIPAGDMTITMQTFGVFLALGILGGKRGTVAVAIYLLLGIVGVPVFSGFRGGLGALMGATGGYIAGFLATALLYWLVTALCKEKEIFRLLGMVLGLLFCYLLGTLWFRYGYLSSNGLSWGAILLKCVVPYLLPDAAKLIMAWLLSRRLRQFV